MFAERKRIISFALTVVVSATGFLQLAITSEANAQRYAGGSPCGVPQYPSFSCGAPKYTNCAPQYTPGGCMPGFSPGCVPFVPTFSGFPGFFGGGFTTQTIDCIELPPSDFRDGTTGSGRNSASRVQQLLPSLPNDSEIPDTTKSTPTDLSNVLGDVFKSSTPSQPASEDCNQAKDLCKNGKFAEALQMIDKEGGQGPSCKYVRAHANLGLGKLDDALKDIQQAIKDRPDYAPNYFTEGAILAEMNKLQDALKSYSKALSLRNDYPRYLSARGGVYYRLGQFIDAIRDYEKAINQDPKDSGTQYMRGLSYFMIGQYQMVVVSFSDFLNLNPNDAAGLYNRGSAYYELGQYNLALADFNKAIALEPKYIPCLYKRCLVNWHLGQWQGAADDADKALALAGWKDENSAYLGLCAYFLSMKKKQTDKAVAVLDDALKNLDSRKWPYPLFQYLKGTITETQLFAATSDTHLTQAQFYVALKMAWIMQNEGNKANAMFETVRAKGNSSMPEYNLAVDELFRNKIKDVSNINRPIKNRYALVVGVSKFKDSSINLRYADKDASDFYNFLIEQAHFPKDNVKLLVNENATRENVLGSLGDNWLPRVANKDDLVLVYFSTHGSPSAMDAKGINYLVAYNTDKDVLYATGIPLQDLTRMIKDKVHADRIVVIMDACHSGAADAGGNIKIDAGNMAASSGQSVICSSLPEEVSWESKKYSNSVFTHHLIDGFKSKGAATSLGDTFEYAKNQVEKEVWDDRKSKQTPVMKSTWSRSDLPIAAQ